MLLRAGQIAGHQIGLADVFMRAAMARAELERALVVFEGEIELLEVAIRVAEVVLQVGIVRVAQRRPLETSRGLWLVFVFPGPFAGRVVRVARRCLWIVLCGVGDCRRRRRQHERECTQQDAPGAGAQPPARHRCARKALARATSHRDASAF